MSHLSPKQKERLSNQLFCKIKGNDLASTYLKCLVNSETILEDYIEFVMVQTGLEFDEIVGEDDETFLE